MGETPSCSSLEKRILELERELEKRKKTERELREHADRLSRIFQEISIPAFVIDKTHRVTHCNKAFENLTGIPAREIIGSRRHWAAFYATKRPVMADLIVDDAPEQTISQYYGGRQRRLRFTRKGFECEGRFHNLRGGEKWLFFTASPLRDPEGRITGAIETLQDITERKRAEEALRKSERRLSILLDFIPYPIVVFNLEGQVYYLNPAFTETFGWTFEELRGKSIPYLPPGLEAETREVIRRLLEEKIVLRHETRRLTKDGRILDVVMRGGIFSEDRDEPGGELVILRDITQEKRIARNNQAILRISRALPEYPDLEDLLDYISREIKELLGTEGALVIFTDEERKELYFKGAAYDDAHTQKKVKEIRFPADKSIAGRVIMSGEPEIIPDTSKDPGFYPGVDEQLGYHTRNMIEVPLKSVDRIIGVLCARNKKEGDFDESDVELLSMIAGTVSLSIENARFSEEIIKAYKNTQALLRISRALPKYPRLEQLLDYLSSEVQRVMDSEGSLVILLDPEKEELFFLGASYDDAATQKRIKEIRFPMDELVAGEVIRTGKPIIVSDTSRDPELYRKRDEKLGYHTRNLLLVPLKGRDQVIGVLCAINKKEGTFEEKDMELLSMVAGTVALSIENARFSEELNRAYREVSSMNRAKDKVINHLSHELKTPISVLSGSLSILSRRLKALPETAWRPTMSRARRNLERIIGIQNQVEDIMRRRHYTTHRLISLLLDECADELETLLAEEAGEGRIVETVRRRIDELFGPREMSPETIMVHDFVRKRIKDLHPLFSHREIDMDVRLLPSPPVFIPGDCLRKVVDGLIKNAVENTPDEGRIEVSVRAEQAGCLLSVKDYGIGIISDARERIFEGFFTTQDTMDYSSRRPFDFNAGGKGADLLRMKIFSERYGFRIEMSSARCRFIPNETDLCPGRISACKYCTVREDCLASGGTTFSLYFPPA